MLFVFLADVHISDSMPQLVHQFKDAVAYAKSAGAKAVVIGGDLFDSPYPSAETALTVKNIIESAKPMQFIAVCGNHDPLGMAEFYKKPPENLYVFPSEITRYEFSGAVFYGVSERSSEQVFDVWQGFCANEKFITLSHGNINPASLARTGASLCLLGHIHKSEVHTLANGVHAVYSGCLAGRGFDECGAKGFYVIDSDSMDFKFVQSSARVYREYFIDLSDSADTEVIIQRMAQIVPAENEVARLVLCGKVEKPIETDLSRLCAMSTFEQIKDETEFELRATDEFTLEGEFIRILQQSLETANEQLAHKIKDAAKEGITALRRKQ